MADTNTQKTLTFKFPINAQNTNISLFTLWYCKRISAVISWTTKALNLNGDECLRLEPWLKVSHLMFRMNFFCLHVTRCFLSSRDTKKLFFDKEIRTNWNFFFFFLLQFFSSDLSWFFVKFSKKQIQNVIQSCERK